MLHTHDAIKKCSTTLSIARTFENFLHEKFYLKLHSTLNLTNQYTFHFCTFSHGAWVLNTLVNSFLYSIGRDVF